MASAKKTDEMVKKNGASVDALDIPNFDETTDWTSEAVGFAPYWSPEEGAQFIGRVIHKEPADDFVRYVMQAGVDLKCFTGPADDAVECTVPKGGYFTISVYYSLQGLFDLYLESGLKPWMKVTAGKKVKTKTPGRTVFQWDVKVPKADKAKADAYRLARKPAVNELPEGGEEATS